MRLPRIVPWRNQEEWQYVCQSLYSSNINEKIKGINRVKAWKTRGKVPHSIESTANFFEIWLMDGQGGQCPSSVPESQLRMMYGMAFVRFVNGLVDTEQKGQYASSIASLADSIGLPSFLVDLRHASTHDNLPFLPLLRSGCLQAIDWLYDNYWQVQRNFVPETQEEVRRLIKEYKQKRKSHMKTERINENSPVVPTDKHTNAILIEMERLIPSECYIDVLIPVLFEVGSLVPETRSKRCHKPGSLIHFTQYQIWKPLLSHFGKLSTTFNEDLLDYSIEMITNLEDEDEDDDNKKHTSLSDTFMTVSAWAAQFITDYFQTDREEDYIMDLLELVLRAGNVYTLNIFKSLSQIDLPVSKEKLQFFIRYLEEKYLESHQNNNYSEQDLQCVDENTMKMYLHQHNQHKLQRDPEEPVKDEDCDQISWNSKWSLYIEDKWKPCVLGCLPDNQPSYLDWPTTM